MSKVAKEQTTTVTFNLREAKDEIKDFIDVNRYNKNRGIDKKIALNLEGEAGVGKTSAVIQVANEMEMEFAKLNLAQCDELAELIGYPLVEYHLSKHDPDEGLLEKWVTEKQLTPFYVDGWHPTELKPRMTYAPPEWIANRGRSGILLLDDWSRAQNRFIQAVMDLIDRAEYLSWKLPEDWHIILTSNPDNGEYHVSGLDEAQRTRFFTAEVKYDKKVWAEWAENKVDGRCINFMLMNPEVVEGTQDGLDGCNPRQWTNFFFSIGNSTDFTKDLVKVQRRGEMAVKELASYFTQFINQKLDLLVPPDRMLLEGLKDKQATQVIIKEIKECINPKGKSYRADIASVLATRFMNYTIKHAKSNPVTREMADRIEILITEELFGPDLTLSIIKKIFNSNKSKFGVLINKEKLRKYITLGI